MEHCWDLRVSCRRSEEIVSAVNSIVPRLPPPVRRQFTQIASSYLVRYDLEGLFARLNNRTIETILAEYSPD